MQNFNQEHYDEKEFLSKNDPKGNKKGQRTGKFVPINEAPDFSVSYEDETIKNLDKKILDSDKKEKDEEIIVPEFMSKVALLYNLKDKLNYETDSKEVKSLEKKIKKLEEEVKYEEEQEKKNVEKMSQDIKILAKKGVAHAGPNVNVAKKISGFKKINEAEDKTENGDVEIAGKKLKSRVLSKLGRFLPNFISKTKNLSMLSKTEFDERHEGNHQRQTRIENLKTLNKQKPKENSEGIATISKLARQNRGKIRNEMLHNPEVWEDKKQDLWEEVQEKKRPEDLLN